jgi:hypothetical protein
MSILTSPRRTNLGAANIAGMATELVLINERYSVITLVFFVTYVVVRVKNYQFLTLNVKCSDCSYISSSSLRSVFIQTNS